MCLGELECIPQEIPWNEERQVLTPDSVFLVRNIEAKATKCVFCVSELDFNTGVDEAKPISLDKELGLLYNKDKRLSKRLDKRLRSVSWE